LLQRDAQLAEVLDLCRRALAAAQRLVPADGQLLKKFGRGLDAAAVLFECKIPLLDRVGRNAQPQSQIVWIDCDDDGLIVNTVAGRQKDRNTKRDPRVSVTIWDRYNPYLFAEVRGRVVSVREFGAFVDLGGGVQGLLHVSEMGWSRVSDTSHVVKPGDVLQKVANRVKSTPELIMRMNNLNGTMLRIGERLLVSHPEFSIVIQRKAKLIVLLNHGAFFKQYHVREEKLGPKQPPKVTTKVAETMAFRDGKRVGFGTKEFVGSTRWIRLGAPAYTIYSVPDSARPNLDQPAPPQGLGLAATDANELSGLVNNRTPVTITD